MALAIDPGLKPSRAVCEGDMVVGDIVEEMNLVLVEKQAGGDGVDGSIAPTLVEETTIPVE